MSSQINTAWSPGNEVLAHNQKPIDEKMCFPVAPPNEIGEVISAQSSFEQGQKPLSLTFRLVCAAVVFFLVENMSYAIATECEKNSSDGMITFYFIFGLGSVFALSMGVLTFLSIFSDFTVSFVGQYGVAIYKFATLEATPPTPEILMFPNADRLFAEKTKHYQMGEYRGSTCVYKWLSKQGEKLLTIKGKELPDNFFYRLLNFSTNRANQQRFHLAVRAEEQFTKLIYPELLRKLKHENKVEFHVVGYGKIFVTQPGLEFEFGSRRNKLPYHEIEGFEVHDGKFIIASADATVWSQSGWFKFAFSDVANGLAFIRLVGDASEAT